jgi:hypothetical protein
MKSLAIIAIVAAIVSIVIGIISRFLVQPVPIAGGIEAQSFLDFTNTCLLFAIAFLVLGIAKQK